MAEKSLEQLKQEIAKAASSGDDVTFNTLIKEYNSRKSEVAKAAAAAALAEANALAGEREAMEKKLWQAVQPALKDFDCYYLKCKSFIVTVNHNENDDGKLDRDGKVRVTGAVKLVVPTIKARSSGGGGGTRVSSKDEYGMSLDEIFIKFATAEEQRELAEAETNSAKWQVKNKVKKAAIASGKLQPAK